MLTREEAIEILELQQCPHAVPYKDYCSGCCYHILDLLKQQLEQPRRKAVAMTTVQGTYDVALEVRDADCTRVLFDDGTVWIRVGTRAWQKLPPIPQDDDNASE